MKPKSLERMGAKNLRGMTVRKTSTSHTYTITKTLEDPTSRRRGKNKLVEVSYSLTMLVPGPMHARPLLAAFAQMHAESLEVNTAEAEHMEEQADLIFKQLNQPVKIRIEYKKRGKR